MSRKAQRPKRPRRAEAASDIARLAAQNEIEACKREYQSENPFWAFKAAAIAIEQGLPVPDWVEDYLVAAYVNLSDAVQNPPSKTKIAPAIVAALGFAKGGVREGQYREGRGNFNPLNIYDPDNLTPLSRRDGSRRYDIAIELLKGTKLGDVDRIVADKHRIGSETVADLRRTHFPKASAPRKRSDRK